MIDFTTVENIATSYGDVEKIESNGVVIWEKPKTDVRILLYGAPGKYGNLTINGVTYNSGYDTPIITVPYGTVVTCTVNDDKGYKGGKVYLNSATVASGKNKTNTYDYTITKDTFINMNVRDYEYAYDEYEYGEISINNIDTIVNLIWDDGYGNSGNISLVSQSDTPRIEIHSGGGIGSVVVFGVLLLDYNSAHGYSTNQYYSYEGNDVICSLSRSAQGLSTTLGGSVDVTAETIQLLTKGNTYTYYVVF